MRKKSIILWIIFLVIADQGTKLIVANYFINTKFDIIDSVVGFHPIYNDKFSYFNAILNLDLGLFPHLIVLIIVQLSVLFFQGYFNKINVSNKLSDVVFIFGQAATICVFCGFFFWEKGVLDFIFLRPFTVDFKDIYLNCFGFLLLIFLFSHKTKIDTSPLKMGGYFKIIWKDFTAFLNKINK